MELVVLDDAAAPWLAGSDLPVHAVGRGLTNYGYSRKLDRWLKEHASEYDRVIVNGVWQYPGFAVWRRLAGSHLPYYVFPHGMLDPWFKRTYPLKHLKKWLYWPWAEYRVLRDAAAVIFTSEQERIEARESFWLYRVREKISPLGVDPPPPVTPRDGSDNRRDATHVQREAVSSRFEEGSASSIGVDSQEAIVDVVRHHQR